MLTETSLLAYQEALLSLGEHQKEVLKCLRRLGQANNQMIARTLRWQINSVTPRVKELRDKKLVKVAFEGPDLFTGRKTIYWEAIKK